MTELINTAIWVVREYQGDIIAVDALAVCVAMPSIAVVLNIHNKRVIVFCDECLKQHAPSHCWEIIENASIFFSWTKLHRTAFNCLVRTRRVKIICLATRWDMIGLVGAALIGVYFYSSYTSRHAQTLSTSKLESKISNSSSPLPMWKHLLRNLKWNISSCW